MFEYISSTKNQKQDSRGTICHTGCKQQKSELFKGQADSWQQDWFSVGIQRVLKWLSWYKSVLAWYLFFECGIDRVVIEDIPSKSTSFVLFFLSFFLTVRIKRPVEVITIQHIKCSISQLVLFQFVWFHWYLYALLIICFVHV